MKKFYSVLKSTVVYSIAMVVTFLLLSTIANAQTVTTFVDATSGLSMPRGLAFDASGNLYVANYGNFTINMVTPAGAVSTFAGADKGLGNITSLVFDGSGNLYVVNVSGDIYKVTPAGVVTNLVNNNSGLSQPWGLAVDASGNLYVANSGNNTIDKVTPTGVVSTFVSSSSGLNIPWGLAFDGSGNLFVANYGNSTLSEVTPAGAVSTFVSSGLSGPESISFDGSGNLFVANASNSSVSKVTLAGAVSMYVNSGLSNPRGLVIDGSGNIYVTNSNIISKITPATTAPIIIGFTPASTGSGSIVTISGIGFTGATAVSFGGISAYSYNVVNDSTITATLRWQGASGIVKVTTTSGTATKAGFVFIPAINVDTTINSCGPVTVFGIKFNSSVSIGTHALRSYSGYDSIMYIFHVNVYYPTTSTTNTTINASQLPYSWNGLTFNAAGSQTAHLTNAAGCDSAATLNLTVNVPSILITVNNTIDPSIQQGVPFNYTITGLDNGGNVMNEMWIDVDSNGIINPAIDLLFVSFTQTDGQQSNQGPGDEDGIANGTITTGINGLYFPVGHYIFKTATSINTSFATFVITPLTATTFSVSGTVTKGGVGVGNIVVELWSQNAQIFEVTNAAGYYIINTNVSAGTVVELSVPNDGSFNSTALGGLIVTPNKYAGPITASMTGADFVIASGKIIMGRVIDAQGNPIAGIEVNASIQNQNGNGYHATTDGNGMYMLSVQSGDYQVIFGSYNSPKGYLLTVYNQQYSNGNSNLVHVLSNTDTIKNIDATLFKGALITGAMKNNGSPVQGNITVFNYNNPSGPVYQSGYDGSAGLYYLYVLPGTYSIYFQQNNSGPSAGVYYNQTSARPGTAINVNNISDTIRNIDVDFGTVPPCISTSSVSNISICQNQLPFNWNGQNFNGNGTYNMHMTNAAGCDSSLTLNLTTKVSSSSYTSISICPSALPYSWNGITFYAASMQTAHITNVAGCDSAATLNLTIKSGSASTTNTSICNSALPYYWNGLTFYTAGAQLVHLTSAAGCDSAATLNLTVNTGSVSTINTTIIASQLPYSWNNLTFNAAGSQTAHLINAAGCDSAATLNLTLNTGITGNGLSFDGVNDNVSIGNPAALQIDSTGSFTIEVWLNPNTANSSSWNAVIDKSYYGSQKGFLIYNGGGTLIVANVNGFATVGSTSLPYNVWTHIAVSYNNGSWKLYKNGILKSTTTNKFYKDASSPVTIGMRTANTGIGQTDAYAGLMDEVRFWNIEKTAAAIQSDMNCDVAQQAGLVAYYRFDQGTASGTNTGLNYANDYSGNGNCGTLNNFALSGATSNWVTGNISSCNSINVNCAPNYVWTGATSTNWSVASNWSNNVLPTAGVTVNIPSAPTNQPVLSTDISVDGMILNGTVSFNGNTFTITGAVSGTGTINGSATSSLVVNSSSTNTINFGTTATDSLLANLTISGAGTVTIGTGVGITNLLTVSSGILNTNNHLTLKSTSIANTAVVGAVGGTITGNVTVERFIPKGLRTYRDLAAIVANAGSIKNNWQEGGNKPVGYGMYITGVKGIAPGGVDVTTGLDKTISGSTSLYTYGSGNWPSVLNTKNTNLDPFIGYRALVRGDRTYNLYALDPSIMSGATTLRTTGNLVTGNVLYTTTNATSSIYTSIAAKLMNGIDNYSFVANPYACPINWELVTANAGTQNITSSYWYFDPTFMSSGYATYVTYNATPGVQINSNPAKSKLDKYIQPGMAFFIQNSNSSNPSLAITESNKAPNSTRTAVFRTEAPNYIHVSLWKNINGENTNIDGAVAVFNNNFTKVIGGKDSKKLINGGENIFITQSNTNLSIAALPVPDENEEIVLNLSQVVIGTTYQLQIDVNQFTTTGIEAFIKDNMLNKVVPATEGINFTPTNDATTYQGRFSIVFRKVIITPDYIKGSVSIYPNPVSKSNFTLQMNNLEKGKYTLKIVNCVGQVLMMQTLLCESSSVTKTIAVKQFDAGVYTIQVTGKGVSYNTELIINK